jgi:hypothetical protein
MGRGGRPPQNRGPKKLLVTKEQLVQIEQLYKQALPLPNPDIHEVIGQQITLAPSKVFFGINLVREKMKLPRLEYPKRKLAVSPEQLMAIETLYEPYLPLPPIGIHKIISKQLRLDEWRVHVAIGLIRKNRNLSRWNEEREDLPEEMRQAQLKARLEKEREEQEKAKARQEKEKADKEKAKAAKAAAEAGSTTDETPEVAPVSASVATAEPVPEEALPSVEQESPEAVPAETPVKRTRTPRARKVVAAKDEPATDDDAEPVVVAAPRRGRPPKALKEK